MLSRCLFAASAAIALATAHAQAPSRITASIDPGKLEVLAHTTHPLASAAHDGGRVDPLLPLRRMVLTLARSDQQQAELTALIAAQKKPGSPGYHLGLTPEQFAERFGPSAGDLQAIKSWLALEGFAVDAVARGGQWIEFSGTARQVERAFHMMETKEDNIIKPLITF